MTASRRLGIMAFVASGLALGAAPALAQNAAQTTASPPPATDTVGPRELQNFSLDGTVTRRSEGPTPVTTSPNRAPSTDRRQAPTTAVAAPSGRAAQRAAEDTRPAQAETTSRTADAEPLPARRVAQATPSPAQGAPATIDLSALPAPAAAEPGFSEPTETVAPAPAEEGGLTLWPWLLLAAVIGGAGALLLWKRRSSEAVADGYGLERVATPGAPAAPPARPARPAAEAPTKPVGIVSTRLSAKPAGVVSTNLRPWLEVSFKPLRCVVDQEHVTLDFEVEVLNSGAVPARDVLVEACMVAAGESQDQEIGAFFAKPAPAEQAIAAIGPLQTINLRSSLKAKRAAMREADVGGQAMLVPLMAFNAVYRASGKEGRTSVSYLLGRSTKSDKLAPFRADLPPRAYAALDTRKLPLEVRN
jgi:hypothetical protein